MIEVNECDRDALRFLWLDNVASAKPRILHYRFTRLPFGLKCSPGLLGATINAHLNRIDRKDDTVKILKQSMYVDDLITGGDTIERTRSLYEASKDIFREAGMNLRKWQSNSDILSSFFADEEVLSSKVNESETNVLGLLWNKSDDTLRIKVPEINSSKNILVTKRSILRMTAKIYDPLGMLSPITVIPRLLFQKLCVDKIDWDACVSPDMELE